jgi:large subunit ribosomal protein L29
MNLESENYLKRLRDMSIDELNDELYRKKKELFNFRMSNAVNQLADTSRISKTKKDIARVLFVMTEKKKAFSNLGAN